MPTSLMAGASYAPLVSPQVAPVRSQSFGTFTGQAPTPTPYGAFTAPDPANYTHDPGYQANVDAQQMALQRSGAARGSLLSGGLMKRLQTNASGLAAQDYGNAFTRSLAAYTTGRETAAQNYDQSLQQYRGNLDAFGANTAAVQGDARLGLAGQQQQYDQGRQGAIDTQANQQGQATANAFTQANAQQAADAQFAAQTEAARRQNEAYSASMRGPVAAPIGALRPRVPTVRR